MSFAENIFIGSGPGDRLALDAWKKSQTKKECEATHFLEVDDDDDEMSCRQFCALRSSPGEFGFELSESSNTAATAPRVGHRAVAAPVAGSFTLVGWK